VRAIAAVAPDNSCAAIGIDVEEIDEARAHALVRMSLSVEECDRVRAVDPTLLAGPIAVWCARESCVKAHGFEVGWFGTALIATAFEETQPRVPDAERAWNISITFEARAVMHAHAWQSRGAMFAAVTRLTEPDASPHAPPHT
jgi:4'-phosphopantetheinyl transferase EntD